MSRPASRQQLQKVQILFRECGIDDRGAFIHNAIAKRVKSTTELSSIEASVVIQMLENAKRKAS